MTEIEWNKPSENNNKQKYTDGILEILKTQSNGVKALIIIGVFCIGLILIFGVIALISQDKNTQLSTQGVSWQNNVLYSINSAINGIISYYDASFKNFFQNIIKTGMRTASGYLLLLFYHL